MRSRTSNSQPGTDRNKQETVCFAGSYRNHVVCQLQLEDFPIRKALGEGAVGLQERGKWEDVPCTVLCLWCKWWLHSAAPLCSPGGDTLPAVPVFTPGRGYCSSRANHGSHCRAARAPRAGQTSGQTVLRCYSWLKPSQGGRGEPEPLGIIIVYLYSVYESYTCCMRFSFTWR